MTQHSIYAEFYLVKLDHIWSKKENYLFWALVSEIDEVGKDFSFVFRKPLGSK